MDPSERLADYGLTLDENIVICDRRIVDEAVTALATLEAENTRLRARVAVLEKALKALRLQALQSDVNSASNEWGREALEGANAALTPTKENDHAQ